MPLEEVMAQLPLEEDIKSAILRRGGVAGEALHCVIEYERCNFSGLGYKNLDHGSIGDAYFQSINWVRDVLNNL